MGLRFLFGREFMMRLLSNLVIALCFVGLNSAHGLEGTWNVDLRPGWQGFSPVVEVPISYTASDFVADAASQGATVTFVALFENGRWRVHIAGMPFNNFPIEVGKVYMAYSDGAASVPLTGSLPSSFPTPTLAVVTATPTPPPSPTPQPTPGGVLGPILNRQKLFASDGAENDYFGSDVAIDGNILVVGAKGRSGPLGQPYVGGAYIFSYESGRWVESELVIPSDGEPDGNFGQAVSVSGNRIVVGAPGATGRAYFSGAVYVYDWDGTAWVETKVFASDGVPGDGFGTKVDLEGNRMVVSAPSFSVNGDKIGAVYVYDWNGTTWNETKLLASDPKDDSEFATSLSLSGNTLVVGAFAWTDQTSGGGAAYLFRFDGSQWSQSRFTASDAASGDRFGQSVGVNGDLVMIGAPRSDNGLGDDGAVYSYRNVGGFLLEAKINHGFSSFVRRFGDSLAVEGNLAVAGTSGEGIVLQWNGAQWLQYFLDPVNSQSFGDSVALSGNFAAFGTERDDTLARAAGAVYVYEITSIP